LDAGRSEPRPRGTQPPGGGPAGRKAVFAKAPPGRGRGPPNGKPARRARKPGGLQSGPEQGEAPVIGLPPADGCPGNFQIVPENPSHVETKEKKKKKTPRQGPPHTGWPPAAQGGGPPPALRSAFGFGGNPLHQQNQGGQGPGNPAAEVRRFSLFQKIFSKKKNPMCSGSPFEDSGQGGGGPREMLGLSRKPARPPGLAPGRGGGPGRAPPVRGWGPGRVTIFVRACEFSRGGAGEGGGGKRATGPGGNFPAQVPHKKRGGWGGGGGRRGGAGAPRYQSVAGRHLDKGGLVFFFSRAVVPKLLPKARRFFFFFRKV